MIFYASGAITDARSIERMVEHRIAILTSFAYKGAFKKQIPVLASLLRAAHCRLPYMLDSGAFTAWNKGKEVDREALIDFYNQAHDEYGDCLDLTCVSLDRIPGRQGVQRTEEDFAEAARETVENYEYMIRRVRPYLKPVYHDGEARWVLDHYRDAHYIGLGANQDASYEYREAWVASVLETFKDKKLHGLAMTGTRMLRTAPWHSVDSAAWVLWAGMGAIAWLRDDGSLKILACSAESPRRKEYNVHLSTLDPVQQEEVRAAVEADGFKVDTLRVDSVERARWNVLVFARACAWATKQPILPPRLIGGAAGGEGGLFT